MALKTEFGVDENNFKSKHKGLKMDAFNEIESRNEKHPLILFRKKRLAIKWSWEDQLCPLCI